MESPAVAVTRIMDPDSDESVDHSLRRLLDLLDASRDLEGCRSAMIKPNICCEKDWRTGATTNPAVVRTIAQWLLENGVENITLADGTIVGQDTMENMRSTGLLKVAEALNLDVLDLNSDRRVRCEVESPYILDRIEIAASPMRVDFLVNIPVMKTHISTSVTLSIKNLKGLLDSKWKRRFHLKGLDGSLADLASVVRPHLNIVDGTVGMEGRGPIGGSPRNAGVLLASRDHLSLDVESSRIMGRDPREINHLRLFAERRGLDLETFRPEVLGTPNLVIHFQSPPSVLDSTFRGVELEWGEPCSGCASVLGAALSHLDREGDLQEIEEMGGITVALGSKANPVPGDRLFVMGKCQYRNRRKGIFIPGCPPQSYVIRGLVYELMGRDSNYRRKDLLEEAEQSYRDEE